MSKLANFIKFCAWALKEQPLSLDVFLKDCICFSSGDQMLKNMFHLWGKRLYPNCCMTVYWTTWQPSSSERVAVNISKIITTKLQSCYALVYGKGRGLHLIHWSPNRYDKDNSVRRGNFLCLKRRDGEWNVCVFWSVRHSTWVSPFTMHSAITTDSSLWEVWRGFRFILLN